MAQFSNSVNLFIEVSNFDNFCVEFSTGNWSADFSMDFHDVLEVSFRIPELQLTTNNGFTRPIIVMFHIIAMLEFLGRSDTEQTSESSVVIGYEHKTRSMGFHGAISIHV